MHTRVFLGEEKKQKKMREGRRKKKKNLWVPLWGFVWVWKYSLAWRCIASRFWVVAESVIRVCNRFYLSVYLLIRYPPSLFPFPFPFPFSFSLSFSPSFSPSFSFSPFSFFLSLSPLKKNKNRYKSVAERNAALKKIITDVQKFVAENERSKKEAEKRLKDAQTSLDQDKLALENLKKN